MLDNFVEEILYYISFEEQFCKEYLETAENLP